MFKGEDRRKDRSKIPFEAMKKQLESATRKGDFRTALVATLDGDVVVAVNTRFDNDILASVASYFAIALQKGEKLGLFSDITQMTLTEASGRIVICRFFEFLSQYAALVIVVDKGEVILNPDIIDQTVQGLQRIVVTKKK